jgi:hypothetical protein
MHSTYSTLCPGLFNDLGSVSCLGLVLIPSVLVPKNDPEFVKEFRLIPNISSSVISTKFLRLTIDTSSWIDWLLRLVGTSRGCSTLETMYSPNDNKIKMMIRVIFN